MFERLHLPPFARAAEWLNSKPLGPAALRGYIVLVNFWTLTCMNWLRAESTAGQATGLSRRRLGRHRRAHAGVLVEQEIADVRRAVSERGIEAGERRSCHVLPDGEAPRRSHGVDVDGTGAACSPTAACTSSCANTATCASARLRSQCHSQAPRLTRSRSDRQRWQHTPPAPL